jgi:hypothetical protein
MSGSNGEVGGGEGYEGRGTDDTLDAAGAEPALEEPETGDGPTGGEPQSPDRKPPVRSQTSSDLYWGP